jgi:hypothetical protein
MICGRSVVCTGHSCLLHQYNLPPRYCCNIVECGVKHHNPNPIDTNAGGVFPLIVSVSALTLFSRFIYYWNVQSLDTVNIIKSKVHPQQACLCNLSWWLTILLMSFGFFRQVNLKLCRFLNRLSLHAADDGYSRNVSCALN